MRQCFPDPESFSKKIKNAALLSIRELISTKFKSSIVIYTLNPNRNPFWSSSRRSAPRESVTATLTRELWSLVYKRTMSQK